MTAANNNDIQDRVNYYMIKAAIAVMSEVNTTIGHALRVSYANKVLAGTANVQEYTVAVYTNVTVANQGMSPVDNDLDTTVSSMFNAFAGVST